MRLVQFMLLALMTLLASGATATKSVNARNLLSFEDVESDSKPTKEERIRSAAIHGPRAGAGTTVVSSNPNGGGTVTVSIYHNNGLMQKIKRWWLKRLGREAKNEERTSSIGALSAAEGGRTGAGASVVSTSDGNTETVTVSIYNNNGLFQRIVRWWKKLWTTEVPKATTKATTKSTTKSTTESTRLRQ